jgi:hypothetical protein
VSNDIAICQIESWSGKGSESVIDDAFLERISYIASTGKLSFFSLDIIGSQHRRPTDKGNSLKRGMTRCSSVKASSWWLAPLDSSTFFKYSIE